MRRHALKSTLMVAVLVLLTVTALAGAEKVKKGNLQVEVTGNLTPKSLPRNGEKPIKVTVGGKVTMSDGSEPPKLKTLDIELNKNGRVQSAGLPVCGYHSIQPASSSRALNACSSSLVGKGTFKAQIALAGQKPYPTGGRMLLFNGREGGKSVLFGHLYAAHPFATSFVIVFAIKKQNKGDFGTDLSATLPPSLLNWGNITGIEISLSRTYSHGGKKLGYLSAGCPTPKGVPTAVFPLTRATFGFTDGRSISATVNNTCKVSG